MSEMEFEEACTKLAETIQCGEQYPESYALMLMVFMNAKDEGETNRMALALAKNAIKETAGETSND